MASNKELTDEALTLGKALGLEVVTQGLNNAGLAELVEGLRLKGAATAPPEVPQAPPPDPALVPLPPPLEAPPLPRQAPVDGASEPAIGGPPRPGNMPFQRYNFQVAEGKSVVTRRGTIGAFEPVTADDFANGQKDLDGLVAAQYVTKKA